MKIKIKVKKHNAVAATPVTSRSTEISAPISASISAQSNAYAEGF